MEGKVNEIEPDILPEIYAYTVNEEEAELVRVAPFASVTTYANAYEPAPENPVTVNEQPSPPVELNVMPVEVPVATE